MSSHETFSIHVSSVEYIPALLINKFNPISPTTSDTVENASWMVDSLWMSRKSEKISWKSFKTQQKLKWWMHNLSSLKLYLLTIVNAPLSPNYRKSRPEVFCKKVVLKNFVKFTGKHLCQSLIFNKVEGLCARVSFLIRLQANAVTPGIFFWHASIATKKILSKIKGIVSYIGLKRIYFT